MDYTYSGYLATILDAPDPALQETLPAITFTAEDIAQWRAQDDPKDMEWQQIPTSITRSEEGVVLKGHFESVHRIDQIDKDDPSFWVPMSTLQWQDSRLPIDVATYPIVEITYRCCSRFARPSWIYSYNGGYHFDGLRPTQEWRTIVRKIPHFGFPETIDHLTFRLFSTSRSTESMEIQSIRFRAMSPAEAAACEAHQQELQNEEAPKHYPLLDEFLPIGVTMDGETAKRMADTMELTFQEYWRLAMEDIARHHHNTIALEKIAGYSQDEMQELLDMAATFGLRLLITHRWPMERFDTMGDQWLEEYIKPFVDAPALLGWSLQDEPPDHAFTPMLQARKTMEAVDPNHPLVIKMRDPNSLPLFSPFFSVSGVSHLKSHAAWQIADIIRTHAPLSAGQQFWVTVPAFVWATDTPQWYTCPETRLMLNTALMNGARGWFSISYHNDPIWVDGDCQRSLTGPFLNFSDIWSELGFRFGRISIISSLILNAQPAEAPEWAWPITCEMHMRSQLPDDRDPISWNWMAGENFHILYIVNNDCSEVASVYIDIPESLPDDMQVIDLTNYLRQRSWENVNGQIHLEMFPGQGEIMLVGTPEVCDGWHEVFAHRMMENDKRLIALDILLAQQHDIDLGNTHELIEKATQGDTLSGVELMKQARESLLDEIYATPSLSRPRSKLIEASALLCGCDGALCRLIGKGQPEAAQELGLRLLPMTRELVRLRVKLRQGKGEVIADACEDLANRLQKFLILVRSKTVGGSEKSR